MNIFVEKGKIHSLIGPNGAGKTTLFNVITRVIQPVCGRVSFKGEQLLDLRTEDIIFCGVARTFQNLQLFQGSSIYDNIYSGWVHNYRKEMLSLVAGKHRAFGKDSRDKIHAVAELMQISGMLQFYPAQLSYGVLKRVEIARALISDPQLLLLDEPAAGLNMDETSELNDILVKLNREGKTILLVEHDMNLVMKISDCITVMNFGAKIAEGTPVEIANNKEVIKVYLGDDEDAAS
jgi:branched-chain amino acid transport system ATP-binding protein